MLLGILVSRHFIWFSACINFDFFGCSIWHNAHEFELPTIPWTLHLLSWKNFGAHLALLRLDLETWQFDLEFRYSCGLLISCRLSILLMYLDTSFFYRPWILVLIYLLPCLANDGELDLQDNDAMVKKKKSKFELGFWKLCTVKAKYCTYTSNLIYS